jgi:hypothetical protein
MPKRKKEIVKQVKENSRERIGKVPVTRLIPDKKKNHIPKEDE